MTKLSVNVNKIATLRNARGGNIPNLLKVSTDIQSFGAHGITIHPRPDERHIKYLDAEELKQSVYTEFNIEGNPIPDFVDLVVRLRPTQVTLVPDAPDAITSNAGWDTVTHEAYLSKMVAIFQKAGIRTSLFVDPDPKMIDGAARTGTDRIELYTENYAKQYNTNREQAIAPYVTAAILASEHKLGINAGHDLSLENVRYFREQIPNLLEVSIGHSLICEAIYLGLENVVNMYLHQLR